MNNRYMFSELLSTAWALACTKAFYRPARLVRRPVYLRGRGHLSLGEGLTTGHGCRFDLAGDGITLRMGRRCELGDYTHIVAHQAVELGDDVLAASKVFISDTDHGCCRGEKQDGPDTAPNARALSYAPVKIGSRVWIGENAVILAGSEIGDGCIVGANSVVRGRFEGGCMLAGAPAKVIKRWNEATNQWEREKQRT